MVMGKQLSSEIIAWGVLAMVTVVMSVILLNVRSTSQVACPPANPVFNESLNLCCLNATGTGCLNNASTTSLYTNVGTYVTGFQEPANWVIIVIIALIGIGLIAYFVKKTKNGLS